MVQKGPNMVQNIVYSMFMSLGLELSSQSNFETVEANV